MKAAIKDGANIDSIGHIHSGTALEAASRNGHVEVVKYLLEQTPKTDINNRSKLMGFTPLHWAAGFNHLSSVMMLLKAGADPNIKTGSISLDRLKIIHEFGYVRYSASR